MHARPKKPGPDKRSRARRRGPSPAWEPHIFSIHNPFPHTVRGQLFQPLSRVFDRALGLDGIYDIYSQARALPPDEAFVDRLLRVLNISYNVLESDLQRIPREGPVVVVANHCFGGIEGIMLASLLSTIRPDVKIMANYMLSRIPEMQDLFVFVDPFGGKTSAGANIKPLKQTLQWLRGGGLLAVFPAGEVAHLDLRRRAIVESQWSPTIGGILRRSGAAVVPVFFEGHNTLLFHLLGLLHPRLRTARLPHEVLNKRNRDIPVHIGRPIPASRLTQFESDEALIGYLRVRAYHLRNRRPRRTRRVLRLPHRDRKPLPEQPIANPAPPERLAAELATLADEQRIVVSGELEAWIARADQIPALLHEIGRLREVTFRAVGEGTGKAIDLDAYDPYYLHLFLWNRESREIAAAYRLGPTDEILPRYGIKGLYTSSLFRYRRNLLDRISPALEMGRSFVRESYQRNYASLLLLWKGIARYVVQNPRYRILFGPVSINDSYHASSRDLLVAFLKVNNFLPELARLVKPRTPIRQTLAAKMRHRRLCSVVNSLEDVDSLIADVETELNGMPILLKQYLKLGGKLIGFNIDPDFSYVLDGLILVDLAQSDGKVMSRYMGKEGYTSFMAHWSELDAP